MTKMSDNQAPKLTFLESAAPSTPASTLGFLYEKTDGILYFKNDGGTETALTGGASGIPATIFDARGDIITASAADTAQRLALGTVGKVLRSDGTDALWAYPPGYEFDYVQITSPVSITGTTQAGATTCITGNSVTYDGSTVILIHVFAPYAYPDFNAAARDMSIMLHDSVGPTVIGNLHYVQTQVTSQVFYHSPSLYYRVTPSAAAHVYTIKAFVSTGTGSFAAGSGGAGVVPAFLRITKV